MTSSIGPQNPHMEGLPGTPGVDRRHRPSDFFHERTNFRFVEHSKRFLVMFLVVVLGGGLALAVRGLNLGIDFEGGVSWQVDAAKGATVSVNGARAVIDKLGIGDYKATISTNPSNGKRTIRVQARIVDDASDRIRAAVAQATGKKSADVSDTQLGGTETFTVVKVAAPDKNKVAAAVVATKLTKTAPTVTVTKNQVTVVLDKIPSIRDNVAAGLATYAHSKSPDVSISTVGPTWGSQVSHKALVAMLVFFFVLAVYLAVRFEWKMSAAAIVAVIHDIIFTVAIYSLTQFTVSPATVTAFLTILGFSLYDTVVVFDKIRENQTTLLTTGRSTYGEMANRSLNEVLMRSLSTSFVAIMPVLSLLIVGSGFFGATALEDFALALFAGLFIGTYSSIFVAAPLLVWWKEREPSYRALIERKAARAAAASRAAPKLAAVSGVNSVSLPTAPTPSATTAEATVLGAAPPLDWDASGVPGPPAVKRSGAEPRPRQQRGRKRK